MKCSCSIEPHLCGYSVTFCDLHKPDKTLGPAVKRNRQMRRDYRKDIGKE